MSAPKYYHLATEDNATFLVVTDQQHASFSPTSQNHHFVVELLQQTLIDLTSSSLSNSCKSSLLNQVYAFLGSFCLEYVLKQRQSKRGEDKNQFVEDITAKIPTE